MGKFKATLPNVKPSQITEYDLTIAYAEIEIKTLSSDSNKPIRSKSFYATTASILFFFGMIIYPFCTTIYQLVSPVSVKLAKECPVGCDPPKTKCNKKTGECEGKAKVEQAPLPSIPLPPTSPKTMMVDEDNPQEWRYGAPDANQDSMVLP